MPRDIFSDVARPRRAEPRAWYTLPLSILAHAAAVALVVVIPLMATDVLPSPASRLPEFMVVAPPLPPDLPPPRPVPPTRSPVQPSAAPNPHAAPIRPADTIGEERAAVVPALPSLHAGPPGPPAAGDGFGVVTSVAPPLPPAPVEQGPIRAGGIVKYPRKVHDVQPVYPAIAIQARIEGQVLIEAIIGTDGRVRDARVTGSKPLLDQAALDAVRQWRFTPSLLNGVPVPVILTITVNFKLQ